LIDVLGLIFSPPASASLALIAHSPPTADQERRKAHRWLDEGELTRVDARRRIREYVKPPWPEIGTTEFLLQQT
jgi:hypothetical protein